MTAEPPFDEPWLQMNLITLSFVVVVSFDKLIGESGTF